MSHHPTRVKPVGVRVWWLHSEDRPCPPRGTHNRRIIRELPGWYYHATKGWRRYSLRRAA